MNATQRDQAFGRRLARNGLRITRSDRQPYPYERLASYRAACAAIPVDAFCSVAEVQSAPVAASPCDAALQAPRLPASGQQAPIHHDAASPAEETK